MGAAVGTEEKVTGADILTARRRAGFIQAEVAKAAGIRREVWPAIEREQIELSQEEYQRLLDVIEKMAAEG